jgi:L-arabinose isomerase
MSLPDLKSFEVWFVTGSQHLYGPETLDKVAEHAQKIALAFNASKIIPVKIVYTPVVKTPEEIFNLCQQANTSLNCIGLICWMHTFSPAKMWINGLKIIQKPLLHLHTQFNRDIPWSSIDMDFMNLNQSAHGDREFGFIMSRMRKERKVVTGHWQEKVVHDQINAWCRAAAGWHDLQQAKFVRFGDNMRQVAVTEGDKVEAQLVFGYSVNTHGVGDLVSTIKKVKEKSVTDLCAEYEKVYKVSAPLKKNGKQHASLRDAARIETGIRNFLEAGNFKGYTDTFEDLHGLVQLPGIATQRLMADGFGFGAEGDWKTAALLRAMKVMASGLPGGNSFMEDYTYHFEPGNNMVLGSHMLEICSSIAHAKPSCEIHPLGIGGKEDPVRLVFNVNGGAALNATMVDMGNRFRLIVNEVEAIKPKNDLPKLPVARVLWKPLPDMKTGCSGWILAGGAHHTVYSQNLGIEVLQDFAAIAGVEMIHIGEHTNLVDLKNQLRWNESVFK